MADDFKITVNFDKFGPEQLVADTKLEIATATHAAMKTAAAEIQQKVRDHIGSAGGGSFVDSAYWPWQSGYTATATKMHGGNVNAAVIMHHKIGFTAVFETGATISAKKGLMWVPLSTTPKTIGGQPTTARRWVGAVGPLKGGRSAKGKPLLYGPLQRGMAKHVPLFFGIEAVKIKKIFNVQGIVEGVRDKLPDYYEDAIEQETGKDNNG